MIRKPTRVASASASLIDLYIMNVTLVGPIGNEEPDLSDHDLIFWLLSGRTEAALAFYSVFSRSHVGMG